MKIAIFNLSSLEEVNYSIDCLPKIKDEVIAASIDLFVDKSLYGKIDDNENINDIIYLDLNDLSIFNFFTKKNHVKYYTKNKYNIAIDTQHTLKSSYFNYLLSGKTAGFKRNNFIDKLIAYYFYDEIISLLKNEDKKDKTKILLSSPFGF